MKPVFRTVMDGAGRATVAVDQVTTSKMAPTKRHDPDNPLADADGTVWEAAVDSAAELVEMVEPARQYQTNVQVLDTAKDRTSDVSGKSVSDRVDIGGGRIIKKKNNT